MTDTPKIESDSFSLDEYKRTLLKATECGYCFPAVSQMKEGTSRFDKFLLLRHDIDISPLNALEMAKLEHSLNVQSSYYVLMHSMFYNPMAPLFRDALHEIMAMGFEVGLHYETNFYEERGLDPLVGILGDASALEKMLGTPILSISQHNPASSTLLAELNNHYVDAYNNELVHDIHYISDSGFKWRNETLYQILGQHDKIHALIHPTTWTFADQDMESTYRTMSQNVTSLVQNEFDQLIASTHSYLARREKLDQERKVKYNSQT